MSYKIEFTRWHDTDPITIIGCGGTGGFVSEGLCRLLHGTAHRIRLVDFDRVEERNLVRQNFYPEDLGDFKSQALAKRLSRKFNRPVGYSVNPFGMESHLMGGNNLVIGCVDSGPARQTIAESISRSSTNWWIDAGNGDSWGQILIGNTDRMELLEHSFELKPGICKALPLPSTQQPHILRGMSAPKVSCAEAVERDEQDPLINQAMAVLVLDAVRKLIGGTCTFMQIYLDLENSTLRTVPVTPENVSSITGIPVSQLAERQTPTMRRGKKAEGVTGT